VNAPAVSSRILGADVAQPPHSTGSGQASAVGNSMHPVSHKVAKSAHAKGQKAAKTHVATHNLKPHGSKHMAKNDPSFVVYAIHTDHLGTPIAMTDDEGVVVWSMRMSPFGEVVDLDEDVDGDENPVTLNLRFPGQYFDEESGLNYNWKRYYDIKIGRFIQPDSLAAASHYSYVINNPLSFIDIFGLLCQSLQEIEVSISVADDVFSAFMAGIGSTFIEQSLQGWYLDNLCFEEHLWWACERLKTYGYGCFGSAEALADDFNSTPEISNCCSAAARTVPIPHFEYHKWVILNCQSRDPETDCYDYGRKMYDPWLGISGPQ